MKKCRTFADSKSIAARSRADHTTSNIIDMNILILSGSPRKNGNTDLLVEAFAKGASEKHHVEVVSVHDYTVHPCMGCNACFSSEGNACVQKDDMPELFDSILTQYQLCLNFFHIEDAGHVLVRGAKEKGGVRGTKAMEEAEALGRAIAQ